MKTLWRTNFLISLIILVGFLSMMLVSYQTYRVVLQDDIENISKLTSSDIYARIDNELTKPMFVAQTMSSDTFLKNWLQQESSFLNDKAHQQEIQHYLNTIRQKYGYDAAYVISSSSNVYYYYGGINKVVTQEDAHDVWYYRFLESGEQVTLNIDQDEVNQHELTVFVDCRIEDREGNLLGVTGVGLKMSQLQQLLQQYEQDYHLNTYLINPDGLVKIHTDSSKIETFNLFDAAELAKMKSQIINNKNGPEIHWYTEPPYDSCLISQYISNLDWYLIVEKDTQPIRDSFQTLLLREFVVTLIILCFLLTLSTFVIRWYNRELVKLSLTDGLTGLPNHKAMEIQFDNLRDTWVGSTLFLFDVDHFKVINDTFGHMYGNEVLQFVGNATMRILTSHGLAVRWGGDEFAGILPSNQAQPLLLQLMSELSELTLKKGYHLTLSVGITKIQPNQTLDELIEQADKAMYYSKKHGKNMLTCFEELVSPTDNLPQ